MSRLIGIGVLAGLLATSTWAVSARQERLTTPHGIGAPASAAQVLSRDITVFPDGRGLPAGRGTAREGGAIYAARCAACHGPKGEGASSYPRLAGGLNTLTSNAPVLTVGSYWPYATTLWDYNRRAMPYLEPGSLTTDEVYSVTAFVLYLNGIVDQSAVLDERTLPLVKMPNRNGFIADPRPDLPRGRD